MNADTVSLCSGRAPQRFERRSGTWHRGAAPGARRSATPGAIAGRHAGCAGARAGTGWRAGSEGRDDRGGRRGRRRRHARRTLDQVVPPPRRSGLDPGIRDRRLGPTSLRPRRADRRQPEARCRAPEDAARARRVASRRSRSTRLQLYTEHTPSRTPGHEVAVERRESVDTPGRDPRASDAHCRRRARRRGSSRTSRASDTCTAGLAPRPLQATSRRFRRASRHAFRPREGAVSGLLPRTDPGQSRVSWPGSNDQLLPCFQERVVRRRPRRGVSTIGTGRSRARPARTRGEGTRSILTSCLAVHRPRRATRGRRIQCWADGMLQHPEILGRDPRRERPPRLRLGATRRTIPFRARS